MHGRRMGGWGQAHVHYSHAPTHLPVSPHQTQPHHTPLNFATPFPTSPGFLLHDSRLWRHGLEPLLHVHIHKRARRNGQHRQHHHDRHLHHCALRRRRHHPRPPPPQPLLRPRLAAHPLLPFRLRLPSPSPLPDPPPPRVHLPPPPARLLPPLLFARQKRVARVLVIESRKLRVLADGLAQLPPLFLQSRALDPPARHLLQERHLHHCAL
ncbi:unnamed protein product [Closterium sp. NIES-54]